MPHPKIFLAKNDFFFLFYVVRLVNYEWASMNTDAISKAKSSRNACTEKTKEHGICEFSLNAK